LTRDFSIKEPGKTAPYRLFCRNNNTGFVSVGTSYDTPDYAAAALCRKEYVFGRDKTFDNARLRGKQRILKQALEIPAGAMSGTNRA
jgi:hypothetical protein